MKHHERCPQAKAPCFCEKDHVDGPPEKCPANECMICAVIDCPHGEPLHFHHDGCPACVFDDDGKGGCSHSVIYRKDIVDKGINAVLGVESVGGFWCVACNQRFAPIQPNERIVKDESRV